LEQPGLLPPIEAADQPGYLLDRRCTGSHVCTERHGAPSSNFYAAMLASLIVPIIAPTLGVVNGDARQIESCRLNPANHSEQR
jgi:hypothetical protein